MSGDAQGNLEVEQRLPRRNETVLRSEVDRSIRRAVDFLRARQRPNGEFENFVCQNPQMENPVFDSNVFTTSFAIDALMSVDGVDVGDIVDKAVGFLLSEMEFGGVWRYWSTADHKHSRLPPDLDDTACIGFALRRAGRTPPDNAWILRCARDSGGRFHTWLFPRPRKNAANLKFMAARALGCIQARLRTKKAPEVEDPRFRVMRIVKDDVDPVVNANVLLYLGDRPETRAAMDFIIGTVKNMPEKPSLYYGNLAFFHAVARAFRHSAPGLGVIGKDVVEQTLAIVDGPAGLNPLETAFAASVLLSFDPGNSAVAPLVDRIIETQRQDGGWGMYLFYCNVLGSEEVTTGFCLEALAMANRVRP